MKGRETRTQKEEEEEKEKKPLGIRCRNVNETKEWKGRCQGEK